MYLGIDFGGTHVDAVLISKKFQILNTLKLKNSFDYLHLIQSIINIFHETNFTKVVISGTLALNSLLTGKAEKVGAIIIDGPGILFRNGDNLKILPGSQNHLGEILAEPSSMDIENAVEYFLKRSIYNLVIASKFAPKNQLLENKISTLVKNYSKVKAVCSASTLSGSLNFSRRLETALLNISIQNKYIKFLQQIKKSLQQLKIKAPVYILKSDGGTMSIEEAAQKPILSVASGPGAGILGVMSLLPKAKNSLVIDIGGTTADIALISPHGPIMEKEGLEINNKLTHVRGLFSKSITVGGDLALEQNIKMPLSKVNLGSAIALTPLDITKRPATLTDALNILNLANIGDPQVSFNAIKLLSNNPKELALNAFQQAINAIYLESKNLIDSINQKPAYTINDILLDKKFMPENLILLGAPAESFKEELSKKFKLPVFIPPYYEFANAIGAALAMESFSADFYADTNLNIINIPQLNYNSTPSKNYSLEQAEQDFLSLLKMKYPKLNHQITFKQLFKQFNDYGQSGKLIRMQSQTKTEVMGFINE